jgi:hypothetical protein
MYTVCLHRQKRHLHNDGGLKAKQIYTHTYVVGENEVYTQVYTDRARPERAVRVNFLRSIIIIIMKK